jgi:hypothetical protein
MTYNTNTATRVAMGCPDDEWSLASWELYRTRHGAFFKVITDHDGESQGLDPLADDEVLAMLQKLAPNLVDTVFGHCPEAGAAERSLTICIPARRTDAASCTDPSIRPCRLGWRQGH